VVAIHVRYWFADGHGNDNEGNENEEIEAGHDEQANVGNGPVEGDADDCVKCSE